VAVRLTGVEHWKDARMTKARRDPDLACEAIGADDRCQLRTQDLDRDLAPMLDIPGEVDVAIPPRPISRRTS
jgi:hypothetical protein